MSDFADLVRKLQAIENGSTESSPVENESNGGCACCGCASREACTCPPDCPDCNCHSSNESVETVSEAHRYDTYVNNMFMKMYHMLQTMEDAVKSGGLLDQRIDMIGGINELEGIRNALGKAADEIEEAHMAATAHIDEDVNERKMTSAEKEKREEIISAMDEDDFKKRYGDRWEEVMNATATKQAMK